MPLFRRNHSSDDAVVLRDGLVLLLDRYKLAAPDSAARIDRLIERLGSFPAPSGLLRELGRFSAPKARRTSNLPELVTDLLRGLAAALSVTCFPNHQMERHIDGFIGELPPQIGVGDARRLLRGLGSLRASLLPLRREELAVREELVSLIADLTSELARASATGSRVDTGLDEVAARLDHVNGPEELRTLRAALLSQVRSLSSDARTLRAQLDDARSQAGDLAEVVARQIAELIDLREKSAQDPLTGVGNRGAFDTWMGQVLPSAQRTGEPMVLLLFDLDHFKQVNDSYGHPIGDEVLKQAAAALAEGVRDGDEVFRVGGEEFAVVLGGASLRVAEAVAERLRCSVATLAFTHQGVDFGVTISGGMALLGAGDDVARLYRRADEALYASKHAGRDRLTIAA